MDRTGRQPHEVSSTNGADDSSFTTPPERSPVTGDAAQNRQSIKRDTSDSKNIDSIMVRDDVETEKGFTAASSQRNDDPLLQGRWKEVLSKSWSRRNIILQTVVWLAFTG